MSSNRSPASLLFRSLACGVLALVAVWYLAACGGDDMDDMMGPGDTCAVGQVLGPGQECSVGTDTFEVMSDGFGCLIEPGGLIQMCSNNAVTKGGFSASNIDDTLDWRIDSMP